LKEAGLQKTGDPILIYNKPRSVGETGRRGVSHRLLQHGGVLVLRILGAGAFMYKGQRDGADAGRRDELQEGGVLVRLHPA
tara:strand:- start:2343 stop:2585 length:243 start_codon:yes stop_codon:yes gene_type:complete